MVERIAATAKLGFKGHAHMLRHACALSWRMMASIPGHSKLTWGHRNIQNTTRYTPLGPDRFKGFWRD
jgi:integrase